jgi:hypothetical protein
MHRLIALSLAVGFGFCVWPSRAQAQELAPQIDHQPLTKAARGSPLSIRARIVSLSGKPIFEPTVFIRVPGIAGYTRIAMHSVTGIADLFSGEVPASLTSGDFDYYIEAFDEDGNGPARVGSPESPLHVAVGAGTRGTAPSRTRPPPQPEASPPVAVSTDRPTQTPPNDTGASTPQRAPAEAVATTPPSRGKPLAPGIILGSLAGVGAVTGIVLAVLLNNAKSDLATAAQDHLPYTVGQYSGGQGLATGANVAFIATGVLGAAAIVYAVWPSSSPKTTTTSKDEFPQ